MDPPGERLTIAFEDGERPTLVPTRIAGRASSASSARSSTESAPAS